MRAEVADGHALGQVATDERVRRLREEHLASVAGGRDARGAMDVEADVAVGARVGLSGVQAHAHAHRWPSGQGSAARASWPRCGGGDRIGGAREGDEEGVALGSDLDAGAEGVAEQRLVPLEHVAVAGDPAPARVRWTPRYR